jgi:hypothetical protein
VSRGSQRRTRVAERNGHGECLARVKGGSSLAGRLAWLASDDEEEENGKNEDMAAEGTARPCVSLGGSGVAHMVHGQWDGARNGQGACIVMVSTCASCVAPGPPVNLIPRGRSKSSCSCFPRFFEPSHRPIAFQANYTLRRHSSTPPFSPREYLTLSTSRHHDLNDGWKCILRFAR